MLYLILLDEMLLLKSLNSVDLLRVSFLTKNNLAVRAGTDQLNEIEIINL